MVNVTLTNVDDPAVIGGNITGSANEGITVTGTLTATDADGLTDGSYFTITGTLPTNGTAAINASTGAWTFIPTDPNWFGSDSFEVTVTDDQGGTTTQIVNVTLTNVDDPAVIGGNITGSANEGVTVPVRSPPPTPTVSPMALTLASPARYRPMGRPRLMRAPVPGPLSRPTPTGSAATVLKSRSPTIRVARPHRW